LEIRNRPAQLYLIVSQLKYLIGYFGFGALGFCGSFILRAGGTKGDRLGQCQLGFHTNGVYTKAQNLVTLPLLMKVDQLTPADNAVGFKAATKMSSTTHDLGNERFYQHFLDPTLFLVSSQNRC